MIRILHLLRPVNGGMANHVHALLTGLGKETFEQYLACPVRQTSAQVLQHAIDVYDVTIQDGMTPISDYRAAIQLVHILQTQPFDILHVHGYKALWIVSYAFANHFGKLPIRRPKIICTLHNFLSARQRWIWKTFQSAKLLNLEQIDQFVTVSDPLLEHIKEICKIQTPEKTCLTVHNGIAPSRQYVEPRICKRIFGVPKDSFVVGAISRLNPDKGIDILVRAMAIVQKQAPDAYLVIIGDGPEKRRLQQLASQLRVNNIRFMGWMPEADQYMKGFQVFVQPSRREGFGMTVIEAMRASIPVIASRVGGLVEVIEDHVSGMLVQPEDPVELANAILYVYRSPYGGEKMAKSGFERMQQRYTYHTMMKQWTEIYLKSVKHTNSLEMRDIEMVPTHL
jgi:glycosyltransferase involved in cell wall biosynthesis